MLQTHLLTLCKLCPDQLCAIRVACCAFGWLVFHLQMRLDINTDAYLLLTIIHSSKVFLTWGSRAGFTNEEPGTGEPEPAQRCVTLGFNLLAEFIVELTHALLRFPISGGEHESCTTETGVQSCCSGKGSCSSGCPMCQGR